MQNYSWEKFAVINWGIQGNTYSEFYYLNLNYVNIAVLNHDQKPNDCGEKKNVPYLLLLKWLFLKYYYACAILNMKSTASFSLHRLTGPIQYLKSQCMSVVCLSVCLCVYAIGYSFFSKDFFVSLGMEKRLKKICSS